MDPYNKEPYKNWLKVGLGLLQLKNGISDLTKSEIEKFQIDLVKKCNINPSQPCSSATCSSKNVIYSKENKQYSLKDDCRSNICNQLIGEIAKMSTQKEIFWSNCNIQKWPTDAWEIAKAYMARGHGKK